MTRNRDLESEALLNLPIINLSSKTLERGSSYWVSFSLALISASPSLFFVRLHSFQHHGKEHTTLFFPFDNWKTTGKDENSNIDVDCVEYVITTPVRIGNSPPIS